MNARPIRRQHARGIVRGFFTGLWYALVSALAFVGIATIVVGAWALQVGWTPSISSLASLRSSRPPQARVSAPPLTLPQLLPFGAESQRTPRVIYMNREGGTLLGGLADNSSRNASTVVAGAGFESYDVPAFRGTAKRWTDIVSCVRGQFEAFDVEIVDHRPVDGPYVMVMVGGQPGTLAAASGATATRGTRITGLAPLGSRPIDNAVVYVFSREMREATNTVCETVAHEVGHAYGLDHVLDCHDPMTHLGRCGRRSFQDTATQCGEHDARTCHNGQPTQNSYQYLLDLLGPRPEA